MFIYQKRNKAKKSKIPSITDANIADWKLSNLCPRALRRQCRFYIFTERTIVHLRTITYNYVNLFILIAIGGSFFNAMVERNLA